MGAPRLSRRADAEAKIAPKKRLGLGGCGAIGIHVPRGGAARDRARDGGALDTERLSAERDQVVAGRAKGDEAAAAGIRRKLAVIERGDRIDLRVSWR